MALELFVFFSQANSFIQLEHILESNRRPIVCARWLCLFANRVGTRKYQLLLKNKQFTFWDLFVSFFVETPPFTLQPTSPQYPSPPSHHLHISSTSDEWSSHNFPRFFVDAPPKLPHIPQHLFPAPNSPPPRSSLFMGNCVFVCHTQKRAVVCPADQADVIGVFKHHFCEGLHFNEPSLPRIVTVNRWNQKIQYGGNTNPQNVTNAHHGFRWLLKYESVLSDSAHLIILTFYSPAFDFCLLIGLALGTTFWSHGKGRKV